MIGLIDDIMQKTDLLPESEKDDFIIAIFITAIGALRKRRGDEYARIYLQSFIEHMDGFGTILKRPH